MSQRKKRLSKAFKSPDMWRFMSAKYACMPHECFGFGAWLCNNEKRRVFQNYWILAFCGPTVQALSKIRQVNTVAAPNSAFMSTGPRMTHKVRALVRATVPWLKFVMFQRHAFTIPGHHITRPALERFSMIFAKKPHVCTLMWLF